MQTQALVSYLDRYLNASLFRDYAPNGLQVEGSPEITRIVLGVSASQALVDHACAIGADCVLVHHGWFWRGENPAVTGMKRRRLAALLEKNVNLIAYHLPLDAHPVVGNNAELGRLLGLHAEKHIGEYDLVSIGYPESGPMPLEQFLAGVESVLRRKPTAVGVSDGTVRRVGWCTGAAQDELLAAAAEGCDVFISGEISERTTYEARENGLMYLAAGHHATERFGIQALGRHLKKQFPELLISYFEVDNPV